MVRLLPQDEGFFALIERAAENLDQAGRLLDGVLADFTDIAAKARQINDLELAGDRLTREVIEKLNRTFLAPFDREEIHELVCRVDDVLDHLDEAVSRMVLYRIPAPSDDCRALGKVLSASTALIRGMMPMLRDLKQPQLIFDQCQRIQKQESEGARIEKQGVAALFDRKLDAVEIIKWKDILGDFEKATDSCSDVANVVESIVIRHS